MGKTMPHYQINGQKISNYKSNGGKADHSCNKLRGYLGKGSQAWLWRETRFNSSNEVNMVFSSSVYSIFTGLSFMCQKTC